MEKNQSTFDEIQKTDVFKGLTAEQYNRVLDGGFRKQLQPRDILFHQGDSATHFYLVNHGQLKLTKLNEQGKEVIIRYIGSGELTAAVTVMKSGQYPVSAESMQETEIIGWDKPTIVSQMQRYPDIAINMLSIILSRIEDIQQRYFEVCTEHVYQRIAHTLLRLMRSAGSRHQDGISIDIPLSRQNIADYSGTTLYTASRTLSAWEKKGWIKSSRERITVVDPHSLVTFADGN